MAWKRDKSGRMESWHGLATKHEGLDTFVEEKFAFTMQRQILTDREHSKGSTAKRARQGEHSKILTLQADQVPQDIPIDEHGNEEEHHMINKGGIAYSHEAIPPFVTPVWHSKIHIAMAWAQLLPNRRGASMRERNLVHIGKWVLIWMDLACGCCKSALRGRAYFQHGASTSSLGCSGLSGKHSIFLRSPTKLLKTLPSQG